MSSRYKKLSGSPLHVIIAGTALVLLFWFIDAVIGAYFFKQATLGSELFSPQPATLWERSLFSLLLLCFVAFAVNSVRKRELLADELEMAILEAEVEKVRSEGVIAAIGDGLTILDTDYRVLLQNHAHIELVGGDFAGQLCYQAYAAGEEVCPECPVALCFRDGRVHKTEKEIIGSSGIFQAEITASPLRDAAGRIIAVIEIFRDVTSRRQVEAALKKQTLFLQQLIDTIPSPIFYKDTDYRFMGCNSAFAECIGIPREQIVGHTFHELLPLEQAASFHRKDVELFERSGIQVYEDEIPCSTGHLRHVIFNKATFTCADGTIAGIVGVVLDITERKQAEALLLNSELRFRNLVESTSEWVWEVDERGIYTYASPRVFNLLGYEVEEVVGKSPFDLMPREEAERVAAIFTSLSDRRSPFSLLENTNMHKDGRLIVLESSGVPFFDGEGIFRGYRGIDRDVTEKRVAEDKIRRLNRDLLLQAAELAAANKELEAFTSSVSHDLRSPLTRIYSASQLMHEMFDTVLDDTGRILVQSISDACLNMEELIEALLSLSMVSRIEISRDDCDLSTMARLIAAELHVAEPERRVTFLVRPELAENGDPRLIRVLLENLLGNAWKYTRKVTEAQIEFGATEKEGIEVFFVRDNGAGFDMAKSDRLFKPFQRLHDNGDFTGTGIGLATVRRIVDRHGGRVWGEGTVGGGATFYFTLQPGVDTHLDLSPTGGK